MRNIDMQELMHDTPIGELAVICGETMFKAYGVEPQGGNSNNLARPMIGTSGKPTRLLVHLVAYKRVEDGFEVLEFFPAERIG